MSGTRKRKSHHPKEETAAPTAPFVALPDAQLEAEKEIVSESQNWKQNLAIGVAVIFVFACVINLNTLEGIFVYDDSEAIETNEDTNPAKTSLANIFLNDWWGVAMSNPGSHKSYRPLTTMTLLFDRWYAGLEPFQFHLTNLLMNAVTCALFTVVSFFLMGCCEQGVYGAIVSGLLFASHPVHTEAVANIVGRAELLAAIFYLLAILVYYHGTISTRSETRTAAFFLALLLSVMAMLSKEQGITAIGVCLALDFFGVFGKPNDRGFKFKAHVIILALCTLFILIFRVRWNHGSSPKWEWEQNPASFSKKPTEKFLTYLYLIFYHAKLLVYPHPLCYTYVGNAIPLVSSTKDPRNIGVVVLICLGLLAFAVERWAKNGVRRAVLVSVFFAVIPFLPATNFFFPVGFVIAERTLFLPSMGITFLAGFAFSKFYNWLQARKSFGHLATIFVAILVLAGSLRTITRNEDWNDAMALYENAYFYFPHVPAHSYNIAVTFEERDDLNKAVEWYNVSLKHDPNYARSLGNYGKLLSGKGDAQNSEKFLKHALEAQPTPKASCELGAVYLQQGKLELALKYLNVNATAECLSMFGIALSQAGKRKDAERALLATVEIEPYHDGLYCNLAAFYFGTDPKRAIKYYEKALQLNPQNEVAASQLRSIKTGVPARKGFVVDTKPKKKSG